MQSSRFPIEVCEYIIDQSTVIAYLPDRYRFLLACAITCTAWVPRTFFNLYREIALKRRVRCDQFLETLAQHPGRAQWIRKLDLWLFEFLPIIPLLAPQILNHCRKLVLGGRHDIQPYPPLYVVRLIIPQLTMNESITSLTLVLDPPGSRISDLYRIIGSLPRLQVLEWRCRVLFNVKPPESAQLSRGKLACHNLKRLTVMAPPLLRIEQFPPADFFELAVEYLKLKVQHDIWPSDNMLDCLESWHQLQELEIEFWSIVSRANAYKPVDFTRILLHVQAAELKRLSITLYPTEGSYFVGRSQIVDSLCGQAMQQVLGGLDQLDQFHVRLYDNSDGFDAAWWNDQLCGKLLPRMPKVTVVCEVTTSTALEDLWDDDGN
ncbi:hypothetical protein GY45DRAFT_1337100 [Cubamyces sp. BRFM 1775]|nr:hypothetical protein GY45DRAFT_1337100 [Cubamyces sp. BRFM 1775]